MREKSAVIGQQSLGKMKNMLLHKRGTGGPPVSSRSRGHLAHIFFGKNIYRQAAKVAKERREEGIGDCGSKKKPLHQPATFDFQTFDPLPPPITNHK
jgi:hypothetical protein